MSDGALSQDEIDALLAGVDSSRERDRLTTLKDYNTKDTILPKYDTEESFKKEVLHRLKRLEDSFNAVVLIINRIKETLEIIQQEKSEEEIRDAKYKEAIIKFNLPDS